MIKEEIKRGLRERYKGVNPLVFQRSCEYATSAGDLFDILDTLPAPPFVWNQKMRRWITLKDVTIVQFSDN